MKKSIIAYSQEKIEFCQSNFEVSEIFIELIFAILVSNLHLNVIRILGSKKQNKNKKIKRTVTLIEEILVT